MDTLSYNSIENIPGVEARAAAFTTSTEVFKEDVDIVPTVIDDKLSYIPWGGDNEMPYHVLDLIERDETLSTCQIFNAEVCYGSGLQYNCDGASASVRTEVDDFLLSNNLPSYFLGVCQDLTYRSSLGCTRQCSNKFGIALASTSVQALRVLRVGHHTL